MLKFPTHTTETVRAWLDNVASEDHPFHGFVGSEGAIQTVLDLIYTAHTSTRSEKSQHGDWDYVWCDRRLPAHVLLVAPRSAGKTEFSRRIGKALGTPFAEIDGTNFDGPEALVDACKRAWLAHPMVAEYGLPPLTASKVPGGQLLVLPPMTLFIDEVHALPGAMQDKILKMTEPKDGWLILNDLKVCFKNVCIIVATTEPGKLKETFKSRFEPRIELDALTVNTVAQIVKNNNPDWLMEDCVSVAKIRRLPRVALAFADLIKASATRSGCSIGQAIEQVRKRLSIYRNGLNRRAAQILRALSNYPDGLSRPALIGMVDGLDEREFVQEILPLLSGSGDTPPLIMVTNRHRVTDEGVVAMNACRDEESELCAA